LSAGTLSKRISVTRTLLIAAATQRIHYPIHYLYPMNMARLQPELLDPQLIKEVASLMVSLYKALLAVQASSRLTCP